jgi:hypothetical protein
MKHVSWAWFAALIAGFGIGLFYAWEVAPRRYVDTTPDTLRSDYKENFRTAIAAAYAGTGNLDRARARMALLGDSNPVQELTAQAQRMLAAGGSFQVAQELAALASDLQAGISNIIVPTSTSAPPTFALSTPSATGESPALTGTLRTPIQPAATETPPSPTEVNTPTPRPTRTPVPTPGAPFKLLNQDSGCYPNLTEGLMQITVVDNHKRPMPGVEITVTWSSGEEHFFTGFKPEIGDGYADYVMQPGVTYSLLVARAGAPIRGLVAPACTDAGGQAYAGGLKLTFQQP